MKESGYRYDQLQSLFENALDVVVAMDTSGVITEWNHQAEVVFGWKKEEAIGKHMSETIIPAKYRDAHVNGLKKFLKTGEGPILNRRIELIGLRRDGSEFPIELTVTPVKTNGDFVFYAFLRDLTEKKMSESSLKKAAALFKAVIESTADGIMVVDQAGKIRHFNLKFIQMWGIPELIIATKDDDKAIAFVLNQLKYPEQFINKVKELYSKPHEISYDTLEFKDGRVFERYSQAGKLGDEYMGRVWSFRDVTAQKTAELKMRNALASRDEFISIAAHEFRTPLTAFSLQIQLISKFLPEIESPKIQKLLGMMQNSKEQVDRLTKLVEDLMDVTRARAGQLTIERTEVNFSEIVGRVAKSLEAELIKSKCTLDLHLGPSIVGMWDAVRIEQVVVNLLSNATKYGAGKPIEVSAKVEGPNVVLMVRDQGIGIGKEDQERIFNRFERAASIKSFTGLGLGLFITHQIVSAHGGSIRVESELGKGSAFIVELPLHSPSEIQRLE